MKGRIMNDPEPVPQNRITATVPHPKSVEVIESPAARPMREKSTLRRVRQTPAFAALAVASVASGLILTLCFFPLSWGYFAWIALVPFLLLVQAQISRPAIYFCAFLGGSAFFWISLSWMPATNAMMRNAWFGLSFYCSLYFPLALFFTRLLDRRTRIPLVVTFPVVWVALDFFRSFFLTGFAWYYLGHTQHILLPVIQIADLGGAYLVTFLVAMVNVAIFEWLNAIPRIREVFRQRQPTDLESASHMRRRLRLSAVVFALLIATLIYGAWRLSQYDFPEGPRVALLQGNVDQNIRNRASSGSGDARKVIFAEYDPLCEYVATFDKDIDLTVWPESALPFYWPDAARDVPTYKVPKYWTDRRKRLNDEFKGMAKTYRSSQLFGLNTCKLINPAPDNFVCYNTALLYHENGSGGRYDKIHRLPFGEYFPQVPDWPIIRSLSPYAEKKEYGIQPGEDLVRFALNTPSGDFSFGVLTCYEDTDPALARQYAVSGNNVTWWDPFQRLEELRRQLDGVKQEKKPPVNFLVNMSNDGWYAGTSEHNEHLAISRFRAIEARRALVRAVNMGISAVIDGNGRVLKPLRAHYEKKANGDYIHFFEVTDRKGTLRGVPNLPVSKWNEFKKCTGVIVSRVPIDNRFSLYSLWGDWFVYLCCFVLMAGVTLAFINSIRRQEFHAA